MASTHRAAALNACSAAALIIAAGLGVLAHPAHAADIARTDTAAWAG